MSTPDEMAAREIADHHTVSTLDDTHLGATIEIKNTVGELKLFQQLSDASYFVSLALPDTSEMRSFQVPADTEVGFHRAAPPPEFVSVDTKKLREYASIADQIKAKEGEIEGLKERRKELQEEILDQFALNGVHSLVVDNRPIYTRTERYPRLLERPEEDGGGRYTYADFVPVLRKLGFKGAITPESVHHKTLTSVLRELLEQSAEAAKASGIDQPPTLPPELARMVELVEEPKVCVGAPRRKGAR